MNTIAFDADDTLWQNEQFFRITQDRFADLLGDYSDPEHLQERLNAAERRNILHYGYGVKGFTLSMLETAIEVTDDKVPASVLKKILEAGREMLSHPLELLDGVEDTLESLAKDHFLLIITKGDLFDQERKIAQSGLSGFFNQIEIVSEKRPETYSGIFDKLPGGVNRAMMVGNSLKSDVIPALEAGAWGVHVPHTLTWVFEQADRPTHAKRFIETSEIEELPVILNDLEGLERCHE